MDRRMVAVIAGAALLLIIGVFAAMAFTGNDSQGNMMTMPNGSTMPANQMPNSDMMTMPDGSTMPANQMP